MNSKRRFFLALAAALLGPLVLAGSAPAAADCHQLVAGKSYDCHLADGSDTLFRDVVFHPTGLFVEIFSKLHPCVCSSTGNDDESFDRESGRDITCLLADGQDSAFAFTARVSGRKLVQGTAASIVGGEVQTFLISCELG